MRGKTENRRKKSTKMIEAKSGGVLQVPKGHGETRKLF